MLKIKKISQKIFFLLLIELSAKKIHRFTSNILNVLNYIKEKKICTFITEISHTSLERIIYIKIIGQETKKKNLIKR